MGGGEGRVGAWSRVEVRVEVKDGSEGLYGTFGRSGSSAFEDNQPNLLCRDRYPRGGIPKNCFEADGADGADDFCFWLLDMRDGTNGQ